MNSRPAHITVNPWLIALTVMLATFMEVLDTSIANVSLQHIAGSLSVSTDESTWIMTTYLIANAIVIPSTAWFGQRFGRKRFLITCVIIFTVGSLFSGLATSLPMLLAMQVVMGAGGGALQPISQAVLFESFPKEKQGVAGAVYGVGIIIAPIIGPVLGGWITDNYSWRWIFLINIPVGVAAVMLMLRFIHDPPWIRAARPPRLDLIGFGCMSLWLACQEVLLDRGQEDDWFGSRFIVTMTGLAIIGLLVFLARELTVKQPFVDLRVLKNYNYALGVALMFFSGVVLYGVTVIIPLFLQTLMGYTALLSGYSMIPRGVGAMISIALAGRLVNVVPGRLLVAAGFFVYGAASFALSRMSLDISPAILVWPVFFTGIGIGLIFVPLTTMTLGVLPPETLGNATGIFNLMRNVGGSVGIALVTTVIARQAQFHQNTLVAHLTPYNADYQAHLQSVGSALASQSGLVAGGQQAVGLTYRTVLGQANLLAYMDSFRAFAVVAFGCLLAAFLFQKVQAARAMAVH
jgi:DHA2 family multidrug resistance protein